MYFTFVERPVDDLILYKLTAWNNDVDVVIGENRSGAGGNPDHISGHITHFYPISYLEGLLDQDYHI